MEAFKFQFSHPARILLVGPSASGKTEFVKNIIRYRNDLFTTPTERIIFVFRYRQSWFGEFPYIEFTTEVPPLLNPEQPSLVIIDDLACEKSVLKECASLFVRGSHHMNASVIFISQNLFISSPDFRTISLNASQFILFKTVRGLHQIEMLGRQIFGIKNSKEFIAAYRDATERPYSYLLLDLEPNQVLD
jgi:hypothetical protein